MTFPVFRGQYVVLLPSGVVGVVEAVDGGDVPTFVFCHITHGERVRIADTHRYRPVMTAAEAAVVERRLVESPAVIASPAAWTAARTHDLSRRVDLSLRGTSAIRTAAADPRSPDNGGPQGARYLHRRPLRSRRRTGRRGHPRRCGGAISGGGCRHRDGSERARICHVRPRREFGRAGDMPHAFLGAPCCRCVKPWHFGSFSAACRGARTSSRKAAPVLAVVTSPCMVLKR
jgi:hypothetical protein